MEDINKLINNLINKEKVLFFDMDGTLVDTDYANFLSFKQAIQLVINPTFIIPFNPNERFNRTILQREFPYITEKDFQEVIRQKERLYAENINHTKLISYMYDILNNFYEMNTTVLVTNCREERALLTLMQHDLTNKFKFKFFRKTIDKDQHINKFENAITNLKIDPKEIIVFENEEFEINEAIKAGILKQNIITEK